MVIPSFFSGIRQIDITVQVVAAPATAIFPWVENFPDGSQGKLRSLSCERRAPELEEALYALHCSFIADEVATGLRFMHENGFVVANSFSNMGVKPRWGLGATYAWQALLAVVLWLVWLRMYAVDIRVDLNRAYEFLRRRPFHVFLPFVASTILISLLSFVFNLPLGISGSARIEEWSFVVITAVVIAPLFEEVVFRGFVHDILTKKTGWILSSIVGTSSFVVVHLLPAEAGMADYMGIFIMGLGLFWLRHVSSSLILCVLAHALYNSLALIWMRFG